MLARRSEVKPPRAFQFSRLRNHLPCTQPTVKAAKHRQNAYLTALFGHYVGGYLNNQIQLRSEIDCTAIDTNQLRSQTAPYTSGVCYFPTTEMKALCLPVYVSRSDSYASWWITYRIDPNYDAYRGQKSSVKSCIGHKYICVDAVRCWIFAIKNLYPYFLPNTP